jgi:hypothetical protein
MTITGCQSHTEGEIIRAPHADSSKIFPDSLKVGSKMENIKDSITIVHEEYKQ